MLEYELVNARWRFPGTAYHHGEMRVRETVASHSAQENSSLVQSPFDLTAAVPMLCQISLPYPALC